MEGNSVIERATIEERDFILSNSIQSVNEGTTNPGIVKEEKALEIVSSILDRGGYHLIYRDKGEIAGWVLLGENTDYFTESKHGFIYDVFVFPKFRGKGYSKRLVQASIENFKEQGYEEIRLNVYSSNFAKYIYKDIGFRELQTIMVYK